MSNDLENSRRDLAKLAAASTAHHTQRASPMIALTSMAQRLSPLVGLCLVALAPGASADPDPIIEEVFEEREEDMAPGADLHFGRGILDRVLEPTYDAARAAISESIGLDFAIEYSYLYQHHSASGKDQWTNNSELDFFAQWNLVKSEGLIGDGSFNWVTSYVWEHDNGAKTEQFKESIGTVFQTSDSDNTDARVRQAYWAQSLLENRLDVYVGQIEVPTFFDDNTYANNDRDKFIAQAWTKTTRSAVNVFGLGAAANVNLSDQFYVRGGFIDGNTNGENPKYSNFKKGEYIYVAELGFTPVIDGWGKGIYRLSPFTADNSATGRQGRGINISFEQETPWPGGAALWLRGGTTERARSELKNFLGGGVVFTRPFGFNRDNLGVAFGWGQPNDNKTSNGSKVRDNTYLFETYYRAQLTERMQFGPDLQIHIKPAFRRSREAVAVGSLRVKITL